MAASDGEPTKPTLKNPDVLTVSDQLSLGKVYGVLGKRRAQILEEDVEEGTSSFTIKVKVPLLESFSLAGELRHSGDVHYQSVFAGFELVQEDPFWEYSLTQEEVEVEGDVDENAGRTQNIARKIVAKIRKRKGLVLDALVVKDATKQRTMTRMK